MTKFLRQMNIHADVISMAISRYPAGGSHGLDHAVRVCRMANDLSEEFDVNRNAMLTAALLHDVGRSFEGPHAENGAIWVRKCFVKSDFDLDMVCRIIQIHNDRTQVDFPEAQFVWEADKLDILGMHGVVRVCQRSGELGGLGLDRDMRSAVSEIRRKVDSLTPDKFFTERGRAIAESKWCTMSTVLEMMERDME